MEQRTNVAGTSAMQDPDFVSPWLPYVQALFEYNDLENLESACNNFSEKDFCHIIQALAANGQEREIQFLFEMAERYHPRSALIWYYRINRCMIKAKDDETPLALFHHCKDLAGDNGLDIWTLVYAFIILFMDEAHLEQYLYFAAKTPYQSIAVPMRMNLLKHVIQKGPPLVVRQVFDWLADDRNTEAFYVKMVCYERGLKTVDVARCRHALFKLCTRYTSHKNWIAFLKFERRYGSQSGMEAIFFKMKELLGTHEACQVILKFAKKIKGLRTTGRAK